MEIPEAYLRNSATNNPDGFGFAYISEDVTGVRRLVTKKTMDFDTFLRQYKRAFKFNPESPFLLHFRIATHGTTDKFNCHPFRINKKMVFIHNGVISGVGTHPLKSDTQLFNEKVLKELPKGWEKSAGIKVLLEKFILGSKILTLDIDATVEIYNESAGHWKEGMWFSNHSYSYGRRPASVFQFGKRKSTKDTTYDPVVYYVCEGCSMRHSEHDMNYFYTKKDEALCYCKECLTAAYMNGDVSLSDKTSKARYSKEVNKINYGRAWDYEDHYDYCGRFMG